MNSHSPRSLTTRAGQVLVFTSLGFGGAQVGNMGRVLANGDAQATLRAAWDLGIRYFDTAPLYGYGLSEQRIGEALRAVERHRYLLSSKVGLLIEALAPRRLESGAFIDPLPGSSAYDYSYSGVMRSYEGSLQRLGTTQIDILLVHDIDAHTHGSTQACEAHLRVLVDQGGWRALDELRRDGRVKAIGAGLNEWQMSERLLHMLDPDIFLLAGRYTLLEQTALDSFLPACQARGVGVVIGSPFNSGVLVTGAVPGARYNYDLAPPSVLERVRDLEAVCRTHAVPLAQAALHFPLRHPAVVCVIPGGTTAAEVVRNAQMLQEPVPSALWTDLRAAGLLRADAPV